MNHRCCTLYSNKDHNVPTREAPYFSLTWFDGLGFNVTHNRSTGHFGDVYFYDVGRPQVHLRVIISVTSGHLGRTITFCMLAGNLVTWKNIWPWEGTNSKRWRASCHESVTLTIRSHRSLIIAATEKRILYLFNFLNNCLSVIVHSFNCKSVL